MSWRYDRVRGWHEINPLTDPLDTLPTASLPAIVAPLLASPPPPPASPLPPPSPPPYGLFQATPWRPPSGVTPPPAGRLTTVAGYLAAVAGDVVALLPELEGSARARALEALSRVVLALTLVDHVRRSAMSDAAAPPDPAPAGESPDLTGFDDLAAQTEKDSPDSPDSADYLPQDPGWIPTSAIDQNGQPA